MDLFAKDLMTRSATESQRLHLRSLGTDFLDHITVSQAFNAIDKIEKEGIDRALVEIRDDGSVGVVDLKPKTGGVGFCGMLAFAFMVLILALFFFRN